MIAMAVALVAACSSSPPASAPPGSGASTPTGSIPAGSTPTGSNPTGKAPTGVEGTEFANEPIGARDDPGPIPTGEQPATPTRITRTELAGAGFAPTGASGGASSSSTPSAAPNTTISSTTSSTDGSSTTSAGPATSTTVVGGGCAALASALERTSCEDARAVAGHYRSSTGAPGLAIGIVLPPAEGQPAVRLTFEFGDATTVTSTSTRTSSATAATAPPGTVPASSGSVWEIGSETKLLTGILLSSLIPTDGGPITMSSCGPRICMSDPLQKYLPPGVSAPVGAGGQAITIGQLATHTSGLPDPAPNSSAGCPPDPPGCLTWRLRYTPALLWAGLQQASLAFDPGAGWLYSDLGYAVLAMVLTNVISGDTSGAAYASLVTSTITGPLSLAALVPETVGAPGLATPYRYRPAASGMPPTTVAGTAVEPTAYFENTNAFVGAGGYVSDIAAMTSFSASVLGYDPTALTPVLQQALVPIARGAGSFMRMGLAWQITTEPWMDCVPFAYKNGGTNGMHSATGVVPTLAYGVTVLSNSPVPADPVAKTLLKELRRVIPAGASATCG